MARQITMWLANDGTTHENEEDAVLAENLQVFVDAFDNLNAHWDDYSTAQLAAELYGKGYRLTRLPQTKPA